MISHLTNWSGGKVTPRYFNQSSDKQYMAPYARGILYLIVSYKVCSKTCLATVLIPSIFAPEKLHERCSASAFFQSKIERINTVARHVLL